MAALVKEQLHLETEVVVGNRGEFTIWVDELCVAKKEDGGFPAEEDVVDAVRRALAGKPR